MADAVWSWFPSRLFAQVYFIIVIACVLLDEFIPRLAGGRGSPGFGKSDRGSFLLIQLAALVGALASLFLRYYNIGVVPFWVQVLALLLLCAGTFLREWAIFLLGRYFSRTVRIESDHRLVTSGPFRWVRHPAYTGMLIMDSSIVLGLGTWVGALLVFVLVLGATLYRIRVEEQALIAAFGEEYRTYMARTALLFPPW